MATPTMVALDKVTVGTAVSSVTLNMGSTLSQAYTDLYLVINAKNTTNGAHCKIRFNGDTGSNYSTTWVEGTSSGASSGRVSNDTAGFVYFNAGAVTNNWSTAKVNIQNYSNSTTYKTVVTRFGNIAQTGAYVNLWRNTAAVTSITLIAVTENFQADSTFSLYGIAATSVGAKATGGAIYSDADYYYHVFSSSGTFTPTQSITADCLVVAGGGAGNDGGGGAGGLLEFASEALSATGYTVTIGAGGSGASNGSNSSFGALTASVGGGKGGVYNAVAAGSGGSGGGAARVSGSYGTATSGQGYRGGSASVGGGNAAGGGGGAGAIGGDNSGGTGGAGGIGSSAYSSWLSVTGVGELSSGTYYIAGGGGAFGGTTAGAAGLGGGGQGSNNSPTPGTNGTANTGGGGGGRAGSIGWGAGGSGVVIVRYAK